MAERHTSDFSKSSVEIIFDLINHYNGSALTSEKVDLLNLVATPDSKQVQVTVSAKRGGGFRGTKNVTYNRLHLDEIPDSVTDFEFEYDITKFSDVIAFVNAGFGVNIGTEDVTINGVDVAVTDTPVVQEYDVVQNFTITAKADSFVWMNSLTFSLTKIRSDLAEVWQVVALDGLYAPFDYPVEPLFQDTDGFIRQREDGSFRIME